MVQVSYPGVYVQEVSSGVRSITSVSTSIGAFFGRASKGPINQAVRILSLSDYERKFGAAFAKGKLAENVQMFFNNGGTDCYVVRLARGAVKASVTIAAQDSTQNVLNVAAKAEGLWANTVRLEVDYNTVTPEESFNLNVIQEDGGTVVATESFTNLSMNAASARYTPDFVNQSSSLVEVTLDSSLGDTADATAAYNTATFAGFSSGRRPYSNTAATVGNLFNTTLFGTGQTSLQISVNGSDYKLVDLSDDGNLDATSHVTIAGDIQALINAELSTLSPAQQVSCSFASNVTGVGRFLNITAATPAVDNVSVKIKRASADDIAQAMMLGVDQGGVEPTRWSNFRPAPNAALLSLGNTATAGDISVMDTIAGLDQGGASALDSITIDGEVVTLNGDYDLDTNPGNRWVKNAAGDSTVTGDYDGVREKLKLIASSINNNAALNYSAELWGCQLALLADDGSINKAASISSAAANFGATITGNLNVRQYTLGTGGSGSYSSGGVDGDDGSAPQYAEYLGSESAQTGFHALDPVDLFNLMVIPEDEEVDGTTLASLWGPASTYCKSRRAFLLVDPPTAWTDSSSGRPTVTGDPSLINDMRISIEKGHSAVFYPRLQYNASGITKTIAPAGAIAGLMARTDANRGVFKAPAGIEAGLKNVLGVTVELTDAENGVLNKKGVNCIRVFPNGLVNWGSRTLDGDDDFGSEWKYIPIRRLALMIEESLFRGTRWVVFEPNDEPLWAKIRMNLNAYMTSLFRQGAFQGSSPRDAFFVKCDAETTTQDDRNKGIVNIKVGFAPLKPAEFVVISIQQMAGEL